MDKRRQAGGEEMEKGQQGKRMRGEARSERKAKQKRGAKSKATEKSQGAVTRQVPSSGF